MSKKRKLKISWFYQILCISSFMRVHAVSIRIAAPFGGNRSSKFVCSVLFFIFAFTSLYSYFDFIHFFAAPERGITDGNSESKKEKIRGQSLCQVLKHSFLVLVIR